MRETVDAIHEQGAPNTNLNPDINDFFFYSENNKRRRCQRNIIKCCGGMIVILGMNAFSFYMGYIVKDINNGSEHR